MGYDKDYDEYLRHAYSLYQRGVDAEGETRRSFLQQALSVLGNVPSGYENRDELESRIRSML